MRQDQILQLLNLIRPVQLPIEYTRVGGKGDGGYIIPEDYFKKVDNVISAGVGGDDSFDLDCANKNLKVFQFDPSITESPTKNPNITFYPIPFGSYQENFENNAGFETIKNNTSLKTYLKKYSLKDGYYVFNLDHILWLTKLQDKQILFKCDVEGSEWVGFALSSELAYRKISILVVEFHGFFGNADESGYKLGMQALLKISKFLYPVIVQVNNAFGSDRSFNVFSGIPIPTTFEITFVNKNYIDGIKDPKYQIGTHHKLADSNNVNEDLILWNPNWFFFDKY
tara:strand:- start:40 stop:888 length:849 start_codon:yes stop_codon:yes gene_type:complete